MSDESVKYLGRTVSRISFRVFVFGVNGANKLVNSYDEYQAALDDGWKSTKEETAVKKLVQVDCASITELAKGKLHHKRG